MKSTGGTPRPRGWALAASYVPLAFFALETQCSEAMHIFDGGFVAILLLFKCIIDFSFPPFSSAPLFGLDANVIFDCG